MQVAWFLAWMILTACIQPYSLSGVASLDCFEETFDINHLVAMGMHWLNTDFMCNFCGPQGGTCTIIAEIVGTGLQKQR